MGEQPTIAALPPTRLSWIDYVKAMAIVLVVFGHASRSVGRSEGLVWSDGQRLADALIYSFHIPLFFILAGVTAAFASGRGLRARLIWMGAEAIEATSPRVAAGSGARCGTLHRRRRAGLAPGSTGSILILQARP